MPIFPGGVFQVDGNYSPPRGVQVGVKVKETADIPHRPVGPVFLSQEAHEFTMAVQGPVVPAGPGRGAPGHHQGQVLPILADHRGKAQLLVLRCHVDQGVLFLVAARPVVPDLGEIALILGGDAVGLGVAAVEKTLPIRGPRQVSKAAPIDGFGQLLAGIHLQEANPLPVAASAGGGVGQELAVPAQAKTGQGHRAVGAEGVRVQDRKGLLSRRLAVKDGLVLQSLIFLEEHPAPRLSGQFVLGIVPELGQAPVDFPTQGSVQKSPGLLVLLANPGLALGRETVFQPAVGIGH